MYLKRRYIKVVASLLKQNKKSNHLPSSYKTETFLVRTIPEAEKLAEKIAKNCPEKMHFGIHELLINAIEHGNLGITPQEKNHHLIQNSYLTEIEKRLKTPQYSQKFVQILLISDPEKLIIIITDQGQGFDPKIYLEESSNNIQQFSGRGISLSQKISFDKITYNEKGNQVIAITYR
jgi:hypothetical protein